MASTVDRWSVELSIHRHEHETRADARLVMDNDGHVLGHGVARALSDLAHMLLGSAAAELEDITHERARLHL